MAQESDQELIQQARGGDRRAFGELVERYYKRIYRLAVHMLRSTTDAEDLTQETFVRAYQALDRFQGSSQPFTWFYRIAVNLSLNIIRSRKTFHEVTSDDDPRIEPWLALHASSGTRDAGTAYEQRELAIALCDAIDQLSDTLRITLLLVVMDGLSHAEAAEVLGCSEGTVSWRVHEARRMLRMHLARLGLFDGMGLTDDGKGRP